MTIKFKILIKTASADSNQVLEIEQGAASKGKARQIKAIAGDKYQVIEEGKGLSLAPESIQVKRVGKHLHILFTGSSEADLIIEDYYEVNSAGYNGIIGQAENGDFYEYLTQDPNEEGLIGLLKDGSEAVEQALGGRAVSGTGAAMVVALTAFNPLLAGFGLVAAGAVVVDAAKNSTAPSAPVARLDATSDTGAKGDKVTTDTTPTLSGTGTPGDTITVKDPQGNVIASAVVAPNGTWEATPVNPLPLGIHNLSVIETNPSGNTSAPTPLPITIEAEGVLVIQGGVYAGLVTTPSVTLITPDVTGNPVVTNANGGATVYVYDNTGTLMGQTTLASDGTWRIDIANRQDYRGTVLVKVVDVNGTAINYIDEVTSSGKSFDTTLRAQGVAEVGQPNFKVADDLNSVLTIYITPVTELAVRTAGISATATAPLANANTISAVNANVASALGMTGVDITAQPTITNSTSFTATNRYDANGAVVLTAGEKYGLVLAKLSGLDSVKGSIDASLTALQGQVQAGGTLTAAGAALVDSGRVVALNALKAVNGTNPENTFTIDTPLNRWLLGDVTIVKQTVNPNETVLTGTALPGSTVTVKLPDGFTTKAVADPTGNFTVALTAAQTPTSNKPITFTGSDGLTQPAANVHALPTPPTAAIALSSDSGIVGDGKTNDSTPTLSGTGKPGDTITIKDPQGNIIGTALVSPNGTWAVTPTTALPDGLIPLSVTATDPSGNVSAPTPLPITIDTTAPTTTDANALTAVLDPSSDTGTKGDNTTSDSTPTLSGKGEPGDTIAIKDANGQVIGSAVVATDGAWAITPATTKLPEGPNALSVSATDPAGNTTTNPLLVTVVVDTTGPAAPAAKLDPISDSGTKGDNSTNDNTPTISGSGTPGDTITVKDPQGKVIASATVQPDGTWAATPANALPEGLNNLAVTATDPAGNPSAPTTLPITIDTTPPSAPAAVLDPTSDSGTKLDKTTNDTTPTISGVGATPGDNITLKDPQGNALGTAVVAPDGTWAITPTTPLTEGLNNLTVTATDPSGNVSAPAPLPVTIDTTAPATTGANALTAVLDPTSDSGTKLDKTTNDTTPTISGVGTPGDTITLKDPQGNALGTAVVAPDGTWAITPTTPLAEGLNNLAVTATDPAGNTSAPATLPITIDTTAPTTTDANALTAVLDPSSDTGTKGDNTTSDSTPTLSGKGAPGDTIAIKDANGQVIGSAVVATDGTWSITPATALPPSVNALSVSATDPAGNTITNPLLVTVVVDTTGPVAPAAKLDPTSDSGTKGDNSTNDNTPTISGSGTPGDTITVKDPQGKVIASATVQPDGTWAATPANALPEGLNNLAVTATDPAGNPSAPTTLPITIDTTPPSAPAAVLDPTSDSGTKLDKTTNDTTPTISGVGTPGDTITLKDPQGNALGTAVVAPDGTWTITPTTPLAEGLNNLAVTATDPAGNTSAPATLPITIDTTAPATTGANALTAVLDPSSDTGTKGDNTTSDSTPTLSGKGAPGDTIAIKDANGQVIGSAVVATDGAWAITPATPLPQGINALSVSATDPAGNTTTNPLLVTVVVDTTGPAAPAAKLDPISDSGTKGDNSTNDNTPTISGSGTPGDTITVKDPQGKVIASATVQPDGTWAITPTTALPDGLNNLAVTATDPAGNPSAPTTLPITIDTTAPAVPTLVTQTTSPTAVVLSGTAGTAALAAGETLVVTVNGATYKVTPDTTGHWTLPITGTGSATPASGTLGALVDGQTYSVTAVVTDAAGNVSTDATSAELTINAATPPAPAAPTAVLHPDTDSGTKGDSTTNVNKPVLSGTGTPGNTITIKNPAGESVGTAVVAPNGSWSVTPTTALPEGLNNLSITETNLTGQTSLPTSLPVTIDTTPPAAPTAVLDPTSDSGTKLDSTTSDNTPTLSGTGATPGDVITIKDPQNNVIGTAVVQTNGTWAVTPTAALPDGLINLAVTATDPAGNTSAATALPITIDTTPPAAPAAVLDPTSDSGTKLDSTTSDNTPTLSGAGATPGDVITIKDPQNNVIGTAVVKPDGTWAVTPTTPLPEGLNNLAVTATDPAGNTSTPTALPITIDTTGPVPVASTEDPLNPPAGKTSLSVDNVTTDNVLSPAEASGNVTITGTARGDFTAGDLVTLVIKGENYSGTVNASGAYSIAVSGADLSGDSDTTIAATLVAHDKSGNPGTITASKAYTLEGAVSTTVSITAITDDSGTAGDFITKDNNGLTVSGTLSTALTAGQKLWYSGDNGVTWIDITTSVSNTAVSYADSTLTSTNTVQMRVQGTGSTYGAAASQLVTIDTTPPAAPAAVLDPTSDSGTKGDSTTSDNTPTLSGAGATPGDVITIKDPQNNVIGTAVVAPDGTWAVTPTTPLPEGLNNLSVTATDPAGNTSAATALPITIDTTGPVPVVSPENPLNPPAGKTSLSVDNVTVDNIVNNTEASGSVTITGTARGEFTAGDVVTLVIKGENYSGTVNASGAYSIAVSGADLSGDSDTTIAATLVAHDKSGNPGTITASKAYTLEGAVSTTVSITAITDDSGTAGDFITKDNNGLTVSGTLSTALTAGQKLWYSGDNGVTWIDITTSVSNTAVSYADSALTNTNTVQMRVQGAGSTYGAVASQLITIDTSAPTQTVVITDILDNEGAVTGTVASGGNTDDTSLNLQGTVSAALASGEVLKVYDGSTYLGNATVSGTSWTFADTRTLVNAQLVSYTAKVVDTADNAGPVATAYTATVNTSAPSITIGSIAGDTVTEVAGGLNGTYDGIERGTGTTSVVTQPVISGTSTNLEGQTITVTLNGTHHTATVGIGGAWSVELTHTDAIALNHGNTYQVIAAATSTGGKLATDTNNSLVVNTATPDIPTVLNNYAGTLTPTLTGSAQKAVPGTPITYMALETGDTLTITVGGATYSGTIGSLPAGITYDASTNHWSVNTATAVPTGTLSLASGNTYDVGVSVSAGGVTKTDISTAELVINTANPTITLNEISTDGYLNAAEAGQSLTITGVTDAQVGSTVTLAGFGVTPAPTATVLAGSGSNTFSVTLTAEQVSAYAIAANAGSQDFTATVVNQFGLSGSDAENVIIDVSAPTFASTGTDVATAQNENIATSVLVYDANATDTGGAVSYSLSGTDAGAFNINASTGEVTLKASPDYESKTSYSFSVVATDLAGNTTTKPVTLAVNNIDEVAPTITSATTANVAENTAATAVVYTATATDTDYTPQGALSISYSLTGTDANLLTIDSSTGQVKLNAASNYEAKSSYSFNVVATDAKGNAGSQAVTLNVTNVDEVAPTITSAATASVAENTAATAVVYTATATDTDYNPQGALSISYSLTGTDANLLTIDSSTGQVKLNAASDYESKSIYNFNVVATDAKGNAGSQAVTLNVTNVDEAIPTITSAATASVAENTAATAVVYTATATDTDYNPQGALSISYSLTGTDANLLTIDSSTGQVKLNAASDYESKSIYNFNVVATDAKGNAGSQAVTLNVTNVDEAIPTITSAATASVAENTAATTVVYTATATDTDYAPGALSISYSLTGTDANLLTIDSSTGQVKLNAVSDYEGKSSYSFNVLATDAKGNAGSQAVTLNVTNVDEAAPTITSSATAAVAENTAATAVVYTATATDTDYAPQGALSISYSLTGTDASLLTIDSSSGAVKLIAASNYEAKTSYSFNVLATDANGNAGSQAVTLNVTNVNEAVIGVNDSASIQEAGGTGNATAGAALSSTTSGFSALNVLANDTDIDSGDTKTVSAILKGTTGTATTVTAATTSANGQSMVGDYGTLVIGADGSYTYTVDQSNATVQALNTSSTALNDVFTYTVKDAAGLTSTATITVAVNGANDAPIMANAIANTAGYVGLALNYTLPAASSSDVDSSSLTYTAVVVDANGNALSTQPSWFSFNPSTRTVSGIPPIGTDTLRVKLTASDGALSVSDVFDIVINTSSITGQASGDKLGHSLSFAGDVNGDGYDDVIVGAFFADTTVVNAGRAYVLFGSATGLPTQVDLNALASGSYTQGFMINGSLKQDEAGQGVSAAGDVNGDGLADLLVGAPGADSNPLVDSGSMYVVYGKTTSSAVNLSALTSGTSTQGFAIQGWVDVSYAGTNVSYLGDVNGDGIADVLISEQSRAYVVYGKTNSNTVNLSALTGATGTGGFVIDTGAYDLNYFANTISAAGDVNGDGLADIILAGTDSGRAYVIYGQTGTLNVKLTAITAGTSTAGFVINGQIAENFAYSVSTAGDVNGDGLADLVVGANTADPAAGIDAGKSYVVFGKAGTSAVNISAIAAGNGGFVINGQCAGDNSGASVAYAGDINGDGLADLLVSAPNGDLSSISNVGRTYVVFGKTTGTAVELSAIAAGSGGFAMNGQVAGGIIGFDVTHAGDLNGDGYDDLAVSSRSAGAAGQAYIVYGVSNYLSSTLALGTGTSAGELVIGTTGNDTLVGGGGVDRFSSGGGNDTIVLTASDISNLANNTVASVKARVDGGGGFDTLRVSGGATLDMTVISNVAGMSSNGSSRIDSIERIDLGTDTAANTLNIAARDVKDMASFNSIHTGTASDDGKTWTNVSTGTALSATTKFHQVVVDGTSSDIVNLKGSGWTNAGTVNDGSSNYVVYQNTATASQVIVKTGVVVYQNVAPVVIDLNRDGMLSYGQVAMDVNGDGHLDRTAWAGAQDGVLVWDKLGDGKVHDNSQYAFSQYGAAGSTDLQGLVAGFDSNHDGVLDAKDAKFAAFKVWQDANQNGVSDAGEVRSLADWGMASIDLVSDGVVRTPVQGVTEAGQTTATATDGSSVLVSDAGFAYGDLAYAAQTLDGLGAHIDLLGANLQLDLSSFMAMHTQVVAVDLSGSGANTLKLSLSDLLGIAPINGVHTLKLTGDADDAVHLVANEWRNTGTTVTEGDHTYAIYNAHNTSAAQLLIDQTMLHLAHLN